MKPVQFLHPASGDVETLAAPILRTGPAADQRDTLQCGNHLGGIRTRQPHLVGNLTGKHRFFAFREQAKQHDFIDIQSQLLLQTALKRCNGTEYVTNPAHAMIVHMYRI